MPKPANHTTKEEYKRLAKPKLRVWRQNTGMAQYEDSNGKQRRVRFGTPGISDICGYMRDGRALFIEIKKEGLKKGTAHQEAFIANAKRMGCIAFIAQSNEDIENELKKEGYI